jgi:hypothetical protein
VASLSAICVVKPIHRGKYHASIVFPRISSLLNAITNVYVIGPDPKMAISALFVMAIAAMQGKHAADRV